MKRRFRDIIPFDHDQARGRFLEHHGLHPVDPYLKAGRIPHIWCAGCGLGVVLSCYVNALSRLESPIDQNSVVSGIGCTGRAAGYLNMDTYHTTHGRAIPFATGLKLARPDMTVTVMSGDGDLFAIGGNHLIHAARRNVNLKIICVNNFNYGMTGGQVASTTPIGAKTSTTPYGNYEHAFNLPHVAHASGAVYVARWTTFHALQLVQSICEANQKEGFTFIEVISPCPTGYGRPNKLGTGLEEMKFYRERSTVINGADPATVGLELRGDITVGKFIDVEKPTFSKMYDQWCRSAGS